MPTPRERYAFRVCNDCATSDHDLCVTEIAGDPLCSCPCPFAGKYDHEDND